jgi:hypothetical protein
LRAAAALAGGASPHSASIRHLAQAPTEDEVVTLVLAHGATDHPELAEDHTAEDIRTWIDVMPE